jgi:hypothetical protein
MVGEGNEGFADLVLRETGEHVRAIEWMPELLEIERQVKRGGRLKDMATQLVLREQERRQASLWQGAC